MRKQRGFTLIELLIAAAIILIIAAIAIPNLMSMRLGANEASAVGSLHTYNTALSTYISTYPDLGFPSNLHDLGPASGVPDSTAAGLLDNVLGCPGSRNCKKAGYRFLYSRPSAAQFKINARPQEPGSSGRRYFYIDQTGVIRYNTTAEASADDVPLS